MSTTAAITLDWLSAEGNKFKAYNISADALLLINKSESLKADIRAYASNTRMDSAAVNPFKGAAEFNLYSPETATAGAKKGFLNIAADRFSTPEGTFNILAHELGHFRVEEPGAAIANARANAWANRDKGAYENACNLTEGYAHYNEVKARDEVLVANRAQAIVENRPLSMREQLLEDRWSGVGPFATSAEGKDHNIVKSIEDAAGAYGQLLTLQEIANSAAFALGENNKSNTTSISHTAYLDFCRKSANDVINSGAMPAPAHGQEQLETIYSADGFVVTNSVTITSTNNDRTATVFDSLGRTTQVTEIDGAQNNADYSTRFTAYDSQGRTDFTDFYRDDGTRDRSDNDQDSSQGWSRVDAHFDAQGREDNATMLLDDGRRNWFDYDQDGSQGWSQVQSQFDVQGREDYATVFLDDGGRNWYDYDQKNERSDRLWTNRVDAQGREDWVSVTQDDGGKDWVDYDQANQRGDRIWANHTDSQGREDWCNVTMDDGRRDWYDYDQSGSQGWSRVESHFDAQGREDNANMFMDDGRRDWYDYDQGGSQGWSRVESHFDAQGREDNASAFMDDGSRNAYDYDQDGSQGWSRVEARFDAQGREDNANAFMDDGSRNSFDYDQDGSQGWSRVAAHFDAQGREDGANMFMDDGSRNTFDYDQDGTQNWNRVESRFDSQGREDSANMFMDNGCRNVYDYDQDGSHGWSRIVTNFNAWGQQDYAQRSFDDGSRLFVDYDFYGLGQHQLIGYNAFGQGVFFGTQVKGVVVGVTGTWKTAFGEGLGVQAVIPASSSGPTQQSPFASPTWTPEYDPYPNAHVEVGPLGPVQMIW